MAISEPIQLKHTEMSWVLNLLKNRRNKEALDNSLYLSKRYPNSVPVIQLLLKAYIASGSGLSKLVKQVLDDFGAPKIQKVEMFNYNIRNILEAHLFTTWKDLYPELSTNFKDLANQNLYSISSN